MFQTTNQMESDFWVIKMMESLPFGPFGQCPGGIGIHKWVRLNKHIMHELQ